jgi:hypothetical protein
VGLKRRFLVFGLLHNDERHGRHGLVRNAAEAAYLKVAVACVERVAQGRRGLSKAAKPEHPFIPSHHALGIKLRHTERLFVEREEWPTALRTGTDGRHDDRLAEANGGTATQLERPRAGDARRTYGFQIRSCRSRRFRPVASLPQADDVAGPGPLEVAHLPNPMSAGL